MESGEIKYQKFNLSNLNRSESFKLSSSASSSNIENKAADMEKELNRIKRAYLNEGS